MTFSPGTAVNGCTVIEYIKGTHNKRAKYLVRCHCGLTFAPRADELVKCSTMRCAVCGHRASRQKQLAKKNYAQFMPDIKIRKMWMVRHSAIMQRCTNPNNSDYPDYGGRGITLCDRWLDNRNFIEDVSKLPGYRNIKLQLDRQENDKGYSPENCHLVTAKQNCANRRKPKKKIEPHLQEAYDEEPF